MWALYRNGHSMMVVIMTATSMIVFQAFENLRMNNEQMKGEVFYD